MVRMTEKGQVTLPKEIRERLDIKPGDEVDFEIIDVENRQLRIKKSPSLSSLFGVLETDKPYPGKDEIRERVGWKLGAKHDDEAHS